MAPIDLSELADGREELNVALRSGDVVHVPRAGSVYVGGSVERPGSFLLRGKTTVQQAILAAGGVKDVADWSDVRLYRKAAVRETSRSPPTTSKRSSRASRRPSCSATTWWSSGSTPARPSSTDSSISSKAPSAWRREYERLDTASRSDEWPGPPGDCFPRPGSRRIPAASRRASAHFWDYWTVLTRRRRDGGAGVPGRRSHRVRLERDRTAGIHRHRDAPHREGGAADPQVRADRARRRTRATSRRPSCRRTTASCSAARSPTGSSGSWTSSAIPSSRSVGRRPGELTDAFLERLRVEPVRNTRLVKVSFESRSPELAAQVVNTLADAVIAQQLDDKKDASQYATRFLTTQVNEARQALQSSETQLSQFLEENDILFVGGERIGERVGERQALISQELATLSDSLLKAKAERIAKESMLTQATRATADALPAVLQDPLIAHLKEEATKLEGQISGARPVLQARVSAHAAAGREHPGGAAADSRGDPAVRRSGPRGVPGRASEGDRGPEARGRAARVWRGSWTARWRGTTCSGGKWTRTASSTRALSTRLKETQVASSLLLSNISVVDRADVPAEALGAAHRAQPAGRVPGGPGRRRGPRVPLRVPGHEHPRSP